LKDAIIFDKGLEAEADFYSAFMDQSQTRITTLADDLAKLNVTNVYTCGLAYDFCVGKFVFLLPGAQNQLES
jgi:nicotinamidase-related amidase